MVKKLSLEDLIGNPLETTAAMGSIIFGILDKLPDQFQFCLCWRFVCQGIGRFDHGFRVRGSKRKYF